MLSKGIAWVRLNKFIARAGIASRREADALIAAGRVTVNGEKCTDFHFQPAPTDYVKLDGKLLHQDKPLHVALNKPPGFVCTRADPHVTDTIYDLLPPALSPLRYVGRLDAKSEGLLFLTNDGELAEHLAHPRFKVAKEYEVTLDRPATPDLARHLERGVILDGRRASAARVRQISPVKLRVVLEQGINRQIRRTLERFGFRAKRLRRIRIGNLLLGDLPSGHWAYLSAQQVRALKLGGDTLRRT